MTISPPRRRLLGTMVTYGYRDDDLKTDLALALRMDVACVEVLPHWKRLPDPQILKQTVGDQGLFIHSAHGCWGGQSIRARRVDLSSLDAAVRSESLDDLKLCIDWLAEAGGRHLVIHPGGLSDPESQVERTSIIADSLMELAEHAADTDVILCVENMPTGVFPGSLMSDLTAIVAELDSPKVALALDTGHANISSDLATETSAAGSRLATTHVHDNNGRADVHLPPGHGTIDWPAWVKNLDDVGYEGPIMLECIRYIRDNPDCLTDDFIHLIQSIARTS